MCLSVNNQKQMAAKVQICGAQKILVDQSCHQAFYSPFSLSLREGGWRERAPPPGKSRVSSRLKMHDSGFKSLTELKCSVYSICKKKSANESDPGKPDGI